MEMPYPLPSNVIPFFLVGVSGLFFGIRGLLSYRRIRSPLTLYYALSGLFIGFSNLLYSLPFCFTHNSVILQSLALIGDISFYAAILLQVKIIWYLSLVNRVKFFWLAIPVAVLSLIAVVASIVNFSSIEYYVVDNQAHFPVDRFTAWIASGLSIFLIIQGLLTVIKAREIDGGKAKVRLLVIGWTFTLGGVLAVYNYLSSGGSNTSNVVIYGYCVLAVMLMATILFISRKKSDSKTEPTAKVH